VIYALDLGEPTLKQVTTYPLRLPPEVKQAVKRKASDERRTFNMQVAKTLTDDLVRSGYLPASAPSEAAA
jgi:hypothetical protein